MADPGQGRTVVGASQWRAQRAVNIARANAALHGHAVPLPRLPGAEYGEYVRIRARCGALAYAIGKTGCWAKSGDIVGRGPTPLAALHDLERKWEAKHDGPTPA